MPLTMNLMSRSRRRSTPLRSVRKWLTSRITNAAVEAAPRLSARFVEQAADWLGRFGPHAPIVARNVADNMRAAGVYSPAAIRGHFDQLARHLSGAMHALRHAAGTEDGHMAPALARIVAERVIIDDSLNQVRAAATAGRGVLLVAPHITDYLIHLAGLNQFVPLTVYLRHVRDPRRTAAKERWYRAAAVRWISEPAESSGPLGRIGRMSAALREGRTLLITPDLPQRVGEGEAVGLLNRTPSLPPGFAFLAMRTCVPMFFLSATMDGTRQRMRVSGPYEEQGVGEVDNRETGSREAENRSAGNRTADDRAASITRRMTWFAEHFAAFVRENPALWYLWGDKRWTLVFRNDAKYCAPGEPTIRAASASE